MNTTFFGTDISTDTDAFPNFFGMSAAAPHVAALAALMKQVYPHLTPTMIETSLEVTATDMDNPYISGFQTGFDNATGFGLVKGSSAIIAAGTMGGDYNHDGTVDKLDYNTWRAAFGNTVRVYGH